MAKRSKKRTKRKATRSPTAVLLAELSEVHHLISWRRLDEAQDRLAQLNQRYPNRPEVLSELVNLCYERQDMRDYLHYSHQAGRRLYSALPG